MTPTPPADAMAESRTAFEKWFSNDGESPKAIERNGDGVYRLQSAYNNWTAWKEAWSSALQSVQAPADPLDVCIALGWLSPFIVKNIRAEMEASGQSAFTVYNTVCPRNHEPRKLSNVRIFLAMCEEKLHLILPLAGMPDMVLVPREPTEAMIAAGLKARVDVYEVHKFSGGVCGAHPNKYMVQSFKAMLAASQAKQAGEG